MELIQVPDHRVGGTVSDTQGFGPGAGLVSLLAARSDSAHPEGHLPPGEPTAILISWRFFGDREHWYVLDWLDRYAGSGHDRSARTRAASTGGCS